MSDKTYANEEWRRIELRWSEDGSTIVVPFAPDEEPWTPPEPARPRDWSRVATVLAFVGLAVLVLVAVWRD